MNISLEWVIRSTFMKLKVALHSFPVTSTGNTITLALLLIDYDLQLYILGQLYQNKTFYVFSSVFSVKLSIDCINNFLNFCVCI